MQRQSGILMPVFSLPNNYGVGDFGRCCYNFIDYLKRANQSVWQILPLAQTGFGNSPYSSIASASISPYYISIELLKEQGLLTEEEVKLSEYQGKYVDYGFLYSVRFPLLKKAFSRFDRQDKEFLAFKKNKDNLDYALYSTLKIVNDYKPFYDWEKGLKFRDKTALERVVVTYAEQIDFWLFTQFVAKKQWLAVKKYANSKGVKILGDLPLYVAADSVDVWVNPKMFKLDKNLKPKKVAGVPPDYFCADGQLWGNPVYNYSEHKKDNFKWWVNRIKNALKLYDLIRIDHFRGLDRYFEIEATSLTAREGVWVKVPSKQLFTALHEKVDKTKLIAEDLGIIDDGVRNLLKKVGYPGMKILSFAFNGEPQNLYLPQNVPENSVCFTGTHDNDTMMGLVSGFNEWDRNNFYNGVKNSLLLLGMESNADGNEGMVSSAFELGYACKSKLFIFPFADLILLGGDYRINEPGTVKSQNWCVRFTENQFTEQTVERLLQLNKKYKRNKK